MVRGLSDLYEELYPLWSGVCDSTFDDEVMCQIECIIQNKKETSEVVSKRLGIPFAIDSLSHWTMHDLDAKLLHRYVGRINTDRHLKEIFWRHNLHVNTASYAFPLLREHLRQQKLESDHGKM